MEAKTRSFLWSFAKLMAFLGLTGLFARICQDVFYVVRAESWGNTVFGVVFGASCIAILATASYRRDKEMSRLKERLKKLEDDKNNGGEVQSDE